MLTTTELAQRYPVTNALSEVCWTRLLDRWRTSGKLKERQHWRVRRAEQGRGRRPREYDVVQVLRLVCRSEHTFAESVRMEHEEAIRGVLASARETVGV